MYLISLVLVVAAGGCHLILPVPASLGGSDGQVVDVDSAPVDAGWVSDAADQGSSLPDTVWPVEQVTVVPAYPISGRNWLDYVALVETQEGVEAADRFHRPDLPCLPFFHRGTYLYSCNHGGEFKKVVVTGVASCEGLSLAEDLQLFRWWCVQEEDGTVAFYSDGFVAGKGIGDTIDYGASPLRFRDNSVEISGPKGYLARSAPVPWWSNTLHDVIADGLSDDRRHELRRVGVPRGNDIYVVTDDASNNGFEFLDDNVGLVVRSGKVMSYAVGDDASSDVAPQVAVRERSFAWIEGQFVRSRGQGILIGASQKVRMNRVTIHWKPTLLGTVSEQGDENIVILDGHGHHLTDVRSSRGYRCAFVRSAYVTVAGFVGSHCRAGFVVREGSTWVYLNKLRLAHSTTDETLQVRGQHTFLSDIVVSNPATHGLSVTGSVQAKDAVVSNLTVANAAGALVDIVGSETVTLVSTLLVNGQSVGLEISGRTETLDGRTAIGIPSRQNTFVHLATAGLMGSDVSVGPKVAGWANNSFAFHGALLTHGDCDVSSALDPGVTETCRPLEPSTANADVGPRPWALFAGAIGRNDSANASDDDGGRAGFTIGLDLVHFDNRYRLWTAYQSAGDREVIGPWKGGTGTIWDFSLGSSADRRVFQRIPAPTAEIRCPDAVTGDRTASDYRGDTFLINATEILFDYAGDDDGLCESAERCIYAPNIGAYQGHGNLQPLTCDFIWANGPVSNVTLFTYSQNGR